MKRKLTASLILAGAMPLAAPALALAQATEEAPPAGGAAIGQVILATAGAMVLTAALLYFGLGHRSGKVPYLGRLANFSERVSGLPGWAALPSAIAAGALLLAFLGFLWDVSIHIDTGRDEGPARQPLALPHPRRPLRNLHRRLRRLRPAAREAVEERRAHRRRLVRAARRRRHGGLRHVRADRLPPRRRLAPHLRPGRHPVGPDPPDADRRRRDDPDRDRDPDGRGRTHSDAFAGAASSPGSCGSAASRSRAASSSASWSSPSSSTSASRSSG